MKVTDIDSVVHLLQSISGWGMAFLVLIILPIYIIGWAGVFKLIKINPKKPYIGIIGAGIIASLILLKIGIDKDQKLVTEATQIKEFIMTYNSDYLKLSLLRDTLNLPKSPTYFDELINRFPESFCYTWEGKEKELQLIDLKSLEEIDKNVDKFVPIAYSELNYDLKKDSAIDFKYIEDNIDNRISYLVLEKMITLYPEEFSEISKNDCHANTSNSCIMKIREKIKKL